MKRTYGWFEASVNSFGNEFEAQGQELSDIRNAMLDYYGTAMQQNPLAAMDLGRIGQMSGEELIQEAQAVGIL